MHTRTRRKLSAGFTLAEASVAIFIMAMLFVGGLGLFVAAARLALKTSAAGDATSDAANAVQRITVDSRHALWLALPTDPSTDWMPPPGTAANSFVVMPSGQAVSTAVELVFPGTAAATVQTGANSAATDTVADRSTTAAVPGNALWIYRADDGGVPNASAGRCVWARGTERGHAVDRALLRSLNPAVPGAAQFARPLYGGGAALPFQLTVKITSAYYSLVGGTQTSDTTSGADLTALAAKSVLLRNHEQSLDHDPGAGGAATAAPPPWQSN